MPTTTSPSSPASAARSNPREVPADEASVMTAAALLRTLSPRNEELAGRITAFMEAHVYPAEPVFGRQLDEAADRWHELPLMAELKAKAKAAGLWNLFLPKRHFPN